MLVSLEASSTLRSSHNSSRSLGRTTGIRSWIGRSRSLAAVVMMVHDGTALPSGSLHTDHSPGKAKGSPDRMTTRMGLLAPPVLCHS